jgi:general secretion pathway protein L
VNEFLLIRLGSRHQDMVHWLVWSAAQRVVIASGELTSAAQLSELTERAGNRPVIVLVPGADIIFRTLTLPGRLTSQTKQALPFMLEDEIASDVEKLHITIFTTQGQQVHIAAVEEEQMQRWLAWLKSAGLKAQQLLPDVLALPLPAENSWSMLQLGSQWLVRQNQWQGTLIDDNWLPTWINSHEQLPLLQSYTPAPEVIVAEWRIALCELPLQLMAENLPSTQANLLHGAYRIVTPWKKQWALLRLPALFAGFWFLLSFGSQLMEYRDLREQQQQLQQQMGELYHQLFPAEKRIINPRAQLKQHLDEMQQTAPTDNFLSQLALLAPLLQQTADLELQQLQFDAGKHEFRLQISAKNFQILEQFREKASTAFETETTNMQNQNGQVHGMLVVRSKS